VVSQRGKEWTGKDNQIERELVRLTKVDEKVERSGRVVEGGRREGGCRDSYKCAN